MCNFLWYSYPNRHAQIKGRGPGAAVSKVKLKKWKVKVKLKKMVFVNHECMYMPLAMVSNNRVKKPLLLATAMHKLIGK